ncbi:MAG: class I SAM-dependent methyltransferase family protein [Candidatus Aenigmarchaeota archaeon]|nr:class I SAM-dependent methyltransferase family protein [Candidatus Aenigmarchaeota archaeon]
MKLKNLLLKNQKLRKNNFLPTGFQRIGDIVILNLKKQVDSLDTEIAQTILDNFPYVKSIWKKSGIKGELRVPEVRHVLGEKRSITIHKENNCLFKMDISKVMFSQGNLKERGRLPEIIKDGEVVIDMFAGIGYFSIPIAKANPGCKIIAIEKNPDSVKLLRENCRLNKVNNIEIVESDCRDFCGSADRILMGYFPGTESFLEKAFSLLKDDGVVHYHNIYKENELWDKPLKELKEFGKMDILYKAKVKSYAPKVWHVVIDAKKAYF